MVSTLTPHFAYQLQFSSGEVERAVRTKDEIRGVLCALYGGRTEDGKFGFDAREGVFLGLLGRLRRSRLLSEEVCSRYPRRSNLDDEMRVLLTDGQELEYYTNEFARNGIHGPCTLTTTPIHQHRTYS